MAEQEPFPGAVDHAVSPLEGERGESERMRPEQEQQGPMATLPDLGQERSPPRNEVAQALERLERPGRAYACARVTFRGIGAPPPRLDRRTSIPTSAAGEPEAAGPARTPASALRRVCRALRTATRLVGPPAG